MLQAYGEKSSMFYYVIMLSSSLKDLGSIPNVAAKINNMAVWRNGLAYQIVSLEVRVRFPS